jgi:hypothetical protein
MDLHHKLALLSLPFPPSSPYLHSLSDAGHCSLLVLEVGLLLCRVKGGKRENCNWLINKIKSDTQGIAWYNQGKVQQETTSLRTLSRASGEVD